MADVLTEPFIHIHIPKTAGTSLRASYIQAFGASRVAFLLPGQKLVKTSELPFGTEELDVLRRTAREQHLLPQFSTMVQRMNQIKYYETFELADIVDREIAVATGHIRHTQVPDAVAHLAVTTVVRNPLERAWSHYSHWQEAAGTMWWHDGSIPFSEDVTFESFAFDPALQNYQANYLGSIACATVGIASNLELFMERVGIAQVPKVLQLNGGLYENLPHFDPGFVHEFEAFHAADYDLYQEALEEELIA